MLLMTKLIQRPNDDDHDLWHLNWFKYEFLFSPSQREIGQNVLDIILIGKQWLGFLVTG